MNMTPSKRIHLTHLAALLLCLALAAGLLPPIAAYAQEEGRTVRVGWYESPFNHTDQFGRRTGYTYEYQQKIAAYTGWRYEYVRGSWTELLQMLIDGEIDLMGDVSYTAGRSRSLLFSMLPMGSEEYYVFVSAERESGLSAENISTFSGKRFGVNKNSVQMDMFAKWAAKKGIQAEIVEMTGSEEESIAMLNSGELDAFVTIDAYSGENGITPVCKIGASDIYFAVSKARPELLRELDAAMLKIQDENIYYNQQLQEKYISYSGANVLFTESELNWLSAHGPVRVGYPDGFLAFCAQDKSSGMLEGALQEFLSLASRCMQNAEIKFEATPFQTTAEALDALRIGVVDCVFPVNLSISDAEDRGVLTTVPQMQSEMCAVVRSAALGDFALDGVVRVAVSEDNPNTDIFLMDHYPGWKRIGFKNTEACLQAVADGKADCFLISNYRVNSIASLLEENKLSTITTGSAVSFSFAISRRGSDLYAILNKVTNLVPTTAVNAALASYSFGEQKLTLERFMRENIVPLLAFVGIIVAVILILLLRSVRSERETRKAMNRIAELNTELSANQEKLKDALTAAEEASKAKTSFLSNMSHEIRTPMNAIIGLDNIALRDQNLSGHTREQLEKIGASARHLLGIINDILDMSRIESGRMVLKNDEFSFRDFLDQINVMINGQCVDKGLEYECHIIGRVNDFYIGDDMKLKQVLINILGNAVKFTPAPGSVTFTVEQLQQFEGYCTLRFIMKDTGVGMSKEFIPKIFEAFSQENSGAANKYGSTGLGMAITKNIVSMMNGDILVESEKGKGSTFTVTVTLKSSSRSVQGEQGDTLPRNLRALIVDDDKVACEHAQLVASSIGMESETALGGEEALKKLIAHREKNTPFQLVITDYKMPGMDGLLLTRAIRGLDGGDTAIILLTGYNWDDIQEEAKNAGVDGIMSKPVFTDSLLHEAASILKRKGKSGAEEEKPAEEAFALKENALKGCRVLLAEDMEINAEILKDLLEMEDVEGELAENGQIAVDMFSAHPAGYYDAILMDVRMPVMDGLEATRTIRALERPDAKTIPIIAMTANAFDEDVQRSLQSGMNAHLSKPVEPDRLYETLDQMIHHRQ